MGLIAKYAKPLIVVVVLVVLFFATRLYNIGELPLFTDEAIYIRWSQIAEQDANWRFISLTDGKQPSFVWANIVTMKFIDDPLLSGRLVAVLSGFFGLIGIFFAASEIFKSRKVGIAAAFLYIIYPFTLVYDRMALYDSLVATTTVWALYFEVLLIRFRRLDISLILGMVIGAGVLTKTSAFFSIYLLPTTAVLFDLKTKKRYQEFAKWIGLAVVSATLGYVIYSILRLSPYFNIIGDKNNTFVYTFSEWLSHPFNFFAGNLNGLTDWFISYATIPLFLLIVVSFFIGGLKYFREKLLLLAWFTLPFVALALFGKVLYPRFILFMTIPLLILAAYSLAFFVDKAKNYAVKAIIIVAAVALMLRSDYYILEDFARAPIADSDLNQFMNSWPAGGGYRELVAFLTERSADEKIYVVSEGTFGSLPTNTIEIYLDRNENIEKKGLWPIPDKIPQDLLERAKNTPVYFVFNQTQEPPTEWQKHLKLVEKHQKGIGDWYMSIYEVIPES